MNPAVNALRRIIAFFIRHSGRHTREDFNARLDGLHRIDMKAPLFNGPDHFALEHQVLYIGAGNQHALPASEPLGLADLEKPFDLLVDPADGLNLPFLVNRAGHRQTLINGYAGKTGEDRIQFCGGGAVAVDTCIALLESNANGERQRILLRKSAPQIARQNQDPLIVRVAAQPGFALDIHNPRLPHEGFGGDARGPAEADLAHLINGQGIDLARDVTVHIDQDGVVRISGVKLLFIEIVAEAVLIEGFDDMGFVYQLSLLLTGPIVGLLNDAHNGAKAQGEFGLIRNSLGAEFYYRGHGRW